MAMRANTFALRVGAAGLVGWAVLACERSEPAKTPPPAIASIACTSDAECRVPPCGPCQTGTTVTPEMMERECVVAECRSPSTTAWCTPRHVCEVK